MKPIKLSKPIDAHGKELTELKMKNPSTGQIIKIGPIMSIAPDESMVYRNEVVAKYISKLAGIPASSVEELAVADFSACKMELAGFLGAAAI